MHTRLLLSAVLAVALGACTTSGPRSAEPLRLDATSDASAQRTFQQMMDRADADGKRELAMALLKLNLAGVQSAYEVVQRPELQTMTIATVRDRVAGMTAGEIVALANQTSTAEVEEVRTLRHILEDAEVERRGHP